jgi:hypothetical protein
MKARWKILIATAIFLMMFAGVWLATIRVGPQNEVEAYKNSLRARGEKLEISEVLPPSVPPEQNGADIVRQAFALFGPNFDNVYVSNNPPMMRMVAPGKAMIGWAQPDINSGNYANSWKNIAAAVEEEDGTIEKLTEAMNYPEIDFQLDYSKGPDLLLRHLSLLKQCAQRLSIAAMCELHNDNATSATTNLCALLALVQGNHDERTLISQLVRMAMTQIAVAPSWELLQFTNVNDSELAALQKRWEQLEFIEPMEKSFLMERASNEFAIRKMRASVENFNRYSGISTMSALSGSGSLSSSRDFFDQLKDVWNQTATAGAGFMWRTSWSYSDELHALQGDQIFLEAIRAARTNQFFNPAYSNTWNQLYAAGITNESDDWVVRLDIPDFRRIFSDNIGALGATIRKTMATEAAKKIVITAIALKRFQLKHGNFPEKLSELAPEFVSSVPLDPVDGQPLRYRLNADATFLLYSIGENGIDDGGDPTMPASSSNVSFYWMRNQIRDWVWPQPATPEEAQYFYEHPPK